MMTSKPVTDRYLSIASASRKPRRVDSQQSARDDEGINRDFAGKHWTQLSPETVYDHYEDLPLINKADIVLLFPAWLRAIIAFDGDHRSFTIAERISFQLSAIYNMEALDEYRRYFSHSYGGLFPFICQDILWCLRYGEEDFGNSMEDIHFWSNETITD